MKKTFLILSILLSLNSWAQHRIRGAFSLLPLQEMKLVVFDDFDTRVVDHFTTDAEGNFEFIQPNDYQGMALIQAESNESMILILNQEEVIVKGNTLTDGVRFLQSDENIALQDYILAHTQRQQAWPAWHYLEQLYLSESALKNQLITLNHISEEKKRLEQADKDFIKSLSKDAYLKWFIPIRQLVNDMPQSARNFPERIPQHINDFRQIDFTNPNFKTSGLFKELIEGHYLLLENMGQSLDSIYIQMNISSQYLIDNLKENEALLNMIGNHLFNFLESKSLFVASEHLAVKLLSQNSCELESKLNNKLEAYRKLKVGNIGPDICFDDGTLLSKRNANYTLLMFGANDCPACLEALPKLKNFSAFWPDDIETIYLSLDTDAASYQSLDWMDINSCDFKGWEGQAVKDYHIFATPTYFLLDENRKILLRPNSPEHANAWIRRFIMVN